jgi:hypothetical protein
MRLANNGFTYLLAGLTFQKLLFPTSLRKTKPMARLEVGSSKDT